MRRLPKNLPKAAVDLIRWADAAEAAPLAADRVPGARGPELRRLAALGALARALAPTLVEDSPEPLASWARDAATDVDESIVAAVRTSLEAESHDVLATVYEYLVSGPNRRKLGTFFTPPPIVQYMVAQAKTLLSGPPAHIVDPGAGVGAFSLAGLSAWRSPTITAVDVNVVTLGLLAARAKAPGARRATEVGRLVLAPVDYLAWLQEGWHDLKGPRLILGNPPYTRNQDMTDKEKQAARSTAGDLITSGLAGLSAYFLAATLKALDRKDAVCFLLPASWCETRYGRELRQWLWSAKRRRVEVQFFPSRVEVFPGTRVTAMVLLIGPEKRETQSFVARYIEAPANESRAVTVTRSIESDRAGECPPTFTGLLRQPTKRGTRNLVSLGEVAKIRRGVATGASRFFFLTDAQSHEHRLPAQVLRRALVKPAHCPTPCLDVAEHDALGKAGFPCWLLDLNGLQHPDTDERVKAYLALGKTMGVHDTHLARTRPAWHTVELVQPPDLFLSPFGKPFHRVIVNDVRAVGGNNLYGIYLTDDAPWSPSDLALWLRSAEGQRCLEDLARHYQGGSLKIEPKSLRDLKVPKMLGR